MFADFQWALGDSPSPLQLCNICYQFTLLDKYVTASVLSSFSTTSPHFPSQCVPFGHAVCPEGLNSTAELRAIKILSNSLTSTCASSAPTHSSAPLVASHILCSYLTKPNPPPSPTQEHHSCSPPSSPVLLSPLDHSLQHTNVL